MINNNIGATVMYTSTTSGLGVSDGRKKFFSEMSIDKHITIADSGPEKVKAFLELMKKKGISHAMLQRKFEDYDDERKGIDTRRSA